MWRTSVLVILPALSFLSFTAAPAAALDVKVKEVRTTNAVVSASIELRDVMSERFKKTVDENGVLHLRVQVELWESRTVWDRLVYPAIVRVVRMTRSVMTENPLSITIELGAVNRIVQTEKYYVHVIATIGTLAEREADEMGDAVFGRESETNALGSLGRLVVRTALQINDYLQSVTAEARSRRIPGAEIIRP